MRKLLALLTLVQVGLLCGCGGGGGYGGGGTTPPPGVVCSNINASLAQQLQNPAILFSADNNGVLVQMPAVGAGGAATAPGALVFGIGTQSNNALGTATVLTEDPSSGFISALYKSTTYPDGYLDSGSNGIFLNDSTFPTCASPLQSWFCPASTMAESATLTGQNSATATANFSISNAQTTFNGNSGFTAFSDVGGPTSDTAGLDLGMPFFYGRNVFIGIENHTSPGGTGPYFAFSDLTTAIPAAGAPNVEAITVNSGPTALPQPAVNTAYTSVKVCVPGTTTCQTIDNIEVDTGSIGLRIVSSALTITLPAEKDGSGHPMAECQKFADGTSWGSLATADITMLGSGKTASNVNVHIIGDATYPTPPTDCSGTAENTVSSFGANGIIGVGPFEQDCGSACVSAATPIPATYYSCH